MLLSTVLPHSAVMVTVLACSNIDYLVGRADTLHVFACLNGTAVPCCCALSSPFHICNTYRSGARLFSGVVKTWSPSTTTAAATTAGASQCSTVRSASGPAAIPSSVAAAAQRDAAHPWANASSGRRQGRGRSRTLQPRTCARASAATAEVRNLHVADVFAIRRGLLWHSQSGASQCRPQHCAAANIWLCGRVFCKTQRSVDAKAHRADASPGVALLHNDDDTISVKLSPARLHARRFELKPIELTVAQRKDLWQEAVKRVAGSQEAAVKSARDAALIRLTVDVSTPLTVPSCRAHEDCPKATVLHCSTDQSHLLKAANTRRGSSNTTAANSHVHVALMPQQSLSCKVVPSLLQCRIASLGQR